jgi:hypothetical protein
MTARYSKKFQAMTARYSQEIPSNDCALKAQFVENSKNCAEGARRRRSY